MANISLTYKSVAAYTPSVKRNTLSMVALFKKYRAQQLAQEKPKTRKPRVKKTTSEQEIAFFETVWGKIAAINLDECTPEDRKSFVTILDALKGAIEEKMAGLTGAGPPAEG